MLHRIPLIAIAALALAELLLIGYAATPAVTDNYRAYYIDRSTTCLERPASGTYRFGKTLQLREGADAAFSKLVVCGFGYGQPDGAWLQGNVAKLEFSDPPAGPLVLEFNAAAVLNSNWPSQHLTIRANGEAVGSFDFAGPDNVVHRVAIPADIVTRNPERLELNLELADTRTDRSTPLTAQRRSLFLRWIRLSSDN